MTKSELLAQRSTIAQQAATIKEMRELLAQWVYGWDHMSEYPVGSTRELLERTK